MKRWLARAVKAPGSASFAHLQRAVDESKARLEWAENLDDRALALAAQRTAREDAGSDGFTASPQLLAILATAAERTLSQRPFDPQLLACAALLSGNVVELDTGEGKTLVGAMAAAGFAAARRKVHVLSVNDYLARRDAEWMGPLFEVLGLAVGWIGQQTTPATRRANYQHDVVYAPVSEIGYDVLRDRFGTTDTDMVWPMHDVAIVDEADAVMIDEAMSPLVLAGSSREEPADFALADSLVRDLVADAHYAIDDDRATVSLTDQGIDVIEQRLGGVNLYETEHTEAFTRINLALHAHALVERDVDYLVVEGEIKLINTARGRVAQQQRWPDGLHAAIEAKEQLAVSAPGIVLDTITVQDLLAGYTTLVGMSGTVIAVAEDLTEFYSVRSGRVERRLPQRRTDEPQRVFTDDRERMDAVVHEVSERHGAGQPILVGTQSVAESEQFGRALAKVGIDAVVLNARNDAHEASVIARAGEFGAVTISTQLSGRGTDIRLGGAEEQDHARVAAVGGLAVLLVGRSPSERLDAQLRGRSGRQGDPGSTLVFVSTNDDVVQANAPAHLLEKVRRSGSRLDQRTLADIVDRAQRIAEGIRRDQHRDTWDFSRALSRQRKKVLALRGEILSGDLTSVALETRMPTKLASLEEASSPQFVADLTRRVALWCLDEQWCEHLAHMSEVRDGIHLQALAGVNPREEFHRVVLEEFQGFFDAAYENAVGILEKVTTDQLLAGFEALELRRPSATWTYMMSANPLGSPMDRAGRQAGRWLRTRVLKIE
ncbi:preprotein translocase subunit SecA [Microbacterium halimionae]|uniref:Protein translocase subunit SecA n=1 Tax=Microbacterium halimionae TaxID=1526413 RepID=A0A7W3JNZ4_9MICO|nr:accessory Sec system translocase SecA2 [Microbacterium halimionae]MBA8816362.1 preprotein translocase subunit SecA [Microbacterium halimionae]NII96564.1 preprotein translocase subunit SecA [Microbacterium halimionae]